MAAPPRTATRADILLTRNGSPAARIAPLEPAVTIGTSVIVPEDWSHQGKVVDIRKQTVVVELTDSHRQEQDHFRSQQSSSSLASTGSGCNGTPTDPEAQRGGPGRRGPGGCVQAGGLDRGFRSGAGAQVTTRSAGRAGAVSSPPP